jgi:hypothetical protein
VVAVSGGARGDDLSHGVCEGEIPRTELWWVDADAGWFDRGTDVSPIIALYAETGVAAIERGGQAAIDAINVFGNPAAFNFAKLGVAAEALVALGFAALKLAVVAYPAKPLAMVAVASALLDETFDSFGIRLPDELLELDKYTLEAFTAVFDFIEGDVASTPRDTFNDAADALESVGREIKHLFSPSSSRPDPLFEPWKFNLATIANLDEQDLFPFKLVRLDELLLERCADAVWPRAGDAHAVHRT